MSTEIKLGLCQPPEPIYLYVKNAELGGESYLWYHYHIEKDRTIPVHQKGLTGYLSELRLTTKEFKGKDNIKLDIVVRADEIYVVRTGIETNFAKTFLLSASLVQDFSKPLIIAVTAGEENTVFCQLYNAATKTKIYREWNPAADWATLIDSIQSRLAETCVQPVAHHATCYNSAEPPNAVAPQDLRVKQVRKLLNYPLDLIKEYLQFQDVSSPSQLTLNKVDELVKTMCLSWAADKVDHPNYAESSYQKQVVDAVANGADELAAINEWMQQLSTTNVGAA
jgi:hypothetical protein